MSVSTSFLKQSVNPSDKPIISSSLGQLPALAWLALASLQYWKKAKEENKCLLRVIPVTGPGLDTAAT